MTFKTKAEIMAGIIFYGGIALLWHETNWKVVLAIALIGLGYSTQQAINRKV